MPVIVHIEEYHDRKSFDCGNPALNDFLLKRGISLYAGSTYVLVPDPNSPEIMGYFTIAPNVREIIETRDTNPILSPLVDLRYLAVDQRYQKQGIGRELLTEIIAEVLEAAESQPIDALVLEPINSKAEKWFLELDFGFQVTFIPDRKLILYVESMRPVLYDLS